MKYIKKITNKQILYIMTLLILIGVPLTKMLGFYLQKYNVIENYNILNTNYILYFTIPFQVYLYIKRNKVSNNKSNLIDLIIMILILTTITSSITALDPKIAFFGNQFRQESFFVILTYYLLILNWKNYAEKIDIKRIIKLILIITTVHSIYGLLQQYTDFSFILRYSPNKEMISGIAFNPNFVASILITAISITIALFMTEKTQKKKAFLLTLLFTISLINTNSLTPVLTLAIMLLFIPIYLLIIKNLNIKNYLIILSTIIITSILTITINQKLFNIRTCELCDTYQNVFEKENIKVEDTKQEHPKTNQPKIETPKQNQTSTGQYDVSNGRIEIWKTSFEIFKQHPLTGIGYDNFYLAYHGGKYYTIAFETDENGNQKPVKLYYHIVDNPHNVYLHVLTSTGILGFIPYMILLLITSIICLKKKNIILLSAFVAYSIQAFANINVTQIAPIYFIIIGLILSQTKELKN